MPETAYDQAQRLREAYDRKAKTITADKNLSPEGKRNRLAEEWKPVDAAIRQANADEQAARERRRQDIERRHFGLSHGATGQDVIARRDAEDRAARIRTADEAREALAAASSVGDRVLEAAIAHRVYRRARDPIGGRAFGDLLDEYATQNPTLARDLEELAGLNSVQSQTQQVAASLLGRVPPELRHATA